MRGTTRLGSALASAAEVEHADRVVVEWCCGHDSMLGQASTYSRGCRVIRCNAPAGAPIEKPWRCSSNNPKMLAYLRRRCAGDRYRNECQGGDWSFGRLYSASSRRYSQGIRRVLENMLRGQHLLHRATLAFTHMSEIVHHRN
jgi:hypothetical protein